MSALGGVSGKGLDFAAMFWSGWQDAFPDNHITLKTIVGEGSEGAEESVVEGTDTGVLHGPAGEVAPTGRHVSVQFAGLHTVRNDKWVSFGVHEEPSHRLLRLIVDEVGLSGWQVEIRLRIQLDGEGPDPSPREGTGKPGELPVFGDVRLRSLRESREASAAGRCGNLDLATLEAAPARPRAPPAGMLDSDDPFCGFLAIASAFCGFPVDVHTGHQPHLVAQIGDARGASVDRRRQSEGRLTDHLRAQAPAISDTDTVTERPLQAIVGSPFVGRHAEMAHLRAGLAGAFERRGGMFLLSGEPGIGKTRLAEQLVREAEQQGAAAFWGQSTQAEGAPPYWPWVQILRSLVSDLGRSEVARLAGPGLAQILRIVPELRSQFPEVPPAPIEDDPARFGIYDSVAQLLLRIAARRPMVLVLEDLHWADAPSLVLLQLLADALPHSALMVIGTYRDRELAANHPLRTQFADFIRRGETAEIPVAGLTDGDAAGLLRALTAFEPAEDLVQRLQAQTGGNPFFLKELARGLSDEIDEPSQWRASADVLPEGVAAVLRRRIEGLSAECRQMLEVAAVAGNMLELDVIETVTGTERPPLLDLCDEAATEGVIATRGRGYAFTHGLFRDTVYMGLVTVRRADLHRAVGAALEQRTTDGALLSVGRLAHHFAQAALADHSLRNKARGYAVAAGKQASAELAYEEAVRLYDLALAIGGSVDPRERAELLLNLGRARYMAGDVTGAVEAGSEAASLGERLSDSELLARAALVVRGVGGPEISERIKDLCERALRQPPTDLSLRIQLLGQMAVVMGQMPGVDGEPHALQSSAEAMRLAQDAADPDVVFAAIHARQMAISGPDGVEERLQLAQRALDLARDSNRRSIAQWGHGWRADALAQLGRIDEAETELSQLRRLADELHEPRLRWRTLLADSWMAILRGRFEEARILGAEALALGRKIQRPIAEFNHSTHAGVLSFFVGPRSADLDAVAAYMASAPDMGRPLMLNRAVMLAGVGRLAEARFALRPFAELGPKTIRPRFALLPAMAAITHVVAAAGDSELASAVYETLLPYAEYNVATGIEFGGLWGSVARSLGMLAATLEQWDDAAQRYEHAIAFENQMGAPPFVACTKVLYAEMLVRRGTADDLRYARRLASKGLGTSQELGMQPWLERANAVLSRLETLHVADHPLSRRELEIASLVAEGLSNRAIAERLHLSERTAEGHVKNICDKLGFNSRSQVAAWVSARKPIQ